MLQRALEQQKKNFRPNLFLETIKSVGDKGRKLFLFLFIELLGNMLCLYV